MLNILTLSWIARVKISGWSYCGGFSLSNYLRVSCKFLRGLRMSNVSEKTAFVIFERFGFKGESIFNSIDILAIRRLVSSALHVLLQISKKRQSLRQLFF
jgi:hypothetical protein